MARSVEWTDSVIMSVAVIKKSHGSSLAQCPNGVINVEVTLCFNLSHLARVVKAFHTSFPTLIAFLISLIFPELRRGLEDNTSHYIKT